MQIYLEDYMSELTNIENGKVKLSLKIPAEDYRRALESAYRRTGAHYNIPGFRKGKVPRKVIEATYGVNVFWDEEFDSLVQSVYSDALAEHNLAPEIQPNIEFTEVSEQDGVSFTAEVVLHPTVKLGQYKGIEAPVIEYNVTDEEVSAEIQKKLNEMATEAAVEDRPVRQGDIVTLDFAGFMGDEQFEGGTAEGYKLKIGSGSFIPGFEEQMVGMNIGDERDINVTFPEDYGNEDLNGKEAVFETTLNYIKESVTPELTDDWVKENLGESMSLNSVDELKAFVKSTMLYDNQASDVYTALHDKASYADELPQTALDYYRDVLLYRIYTNAQKYGTDMNTLLSSGMMGSSYDSVDAYLADANDSIKSITQQALLMQAVAEKTGFKCDTATMSADFGRYYGTTDPSQYVSAYGENYIKMNVLQSDVMQNLIDNVKYE